ncbi:hypothetical protein RclHR1_24950002 [Rhizophagus clarus]|uniref:Uncharacterized protein n=1 Tax=Rhizophagus clarus TaxID=94130 RepID=A0A2Z6QYC1_9GLOM|nr:hypothetical protein RclHR1_24950002 [Rhizophagus clarus]
MEADSYGAIVRNDWLGKVKANINYETSVMTITWEGRIAEVLIEYRLLPREKKQLQEQSAVNPDGKDDDADGDDDEIDEEEDKASQDDNDEYEDDNPEE